MKNKFKLVSNYQPKGDQPKAISQLVDGFKTGKTQQTLLGVTGSGKTFTMANVIQALQKPTLIMSHNKTLAGQLYNEFKEFFPDNKVCYFISYYDYYQPESYLPASDTFIEKETQINEKIEEYRLEATASLVSREDVIVVASVSCIYGLGSPVEFKNSAFEIKKGDTIDKNKLMHHLVALLYERSDTDLGAGKFRAKGDTIEFVQGYGQYIYRVELFGDEVDRITKRELVSNKLISEIKELTVFPATPFVIGQNVKQQAMAAIENELQHRVPELEPLYAHRLKQRTEYDLEMIRELGFCKGIENYSRHFDQRAPGSPPQCLIDFFPDDFLMILDESHATVPQIGGMYNGDQARKMNLIDYGFRLPSAADNRPLKFEEFETYMKNVLYVSATPGNYETQHSSAIVEQIIRPTYLIDPEVTIKPIDGQVEDLRKEIDITVARGNRVLVTTLTKKMSEDLTDYLARDGVKVRYLHSEIDTMERAEIIRDLRLGEFDVLVGINLLREGLDIPEVELVAILDADKEGFLRNARSLIQTIGRAARNLEGRVVMYADVMTDSIKRTMKETERRRTKQLAYNEEHGVKPQQIIKDISKPLAKADIDDGSIQAIIEESGDALELKIKLEEEMQKAAEELDFEKAIKIRDMLGDL